MNQPVVDIFISYASEDRDRASQFAGAFDAAGWSVWWDRKIITGQAFDQAIEQALEGARCVVVLWSEHSVASEWVKNEAAAGAQRGVLVPALLDGSTLPLEFRRKQAADLRGWDGTPSHSGFRALCEGVAHALGSPARPAPPPAHAAPAAPRMPGWRWAGLAALAVAVGLGAFAVTWWRDRPLAVRADPPANVAEPSRGTAPASTNLAEAAVGHYQGDVISDSKGPSRSDVGVTIEQVDRRTVRVSSDYPRLGTTDVALTRIGAKLINADGDSPFILDLESSPPLLQFNPRGELAFSGSRR